MDTIQDLQAFNEILYDKVQDYIDNPDSYADDAVLAIHKNTYEVVIESPSDLSNDYEQFKLTTFMRIDEVSGIIEPDNDETYELASKYYFVR